jgi:anti-sigma B factor antagonist
MRLIASRAAAVFEGTPQVRTYYDKRGEYSVDLASHGDSPMDHSTTHSTASLHCRSQGGRACPALPHGAASGRPRRGSPHQLLAPCPSRCRKAHLDRPLVPQVAQASSANRDPVVTESRHSGCDTRIMRCPRPSRRSRHVRMAKEAREGSLEVVLSGQLDAATAPGVRARLEAHVDAAPSRLVIDLRAVEFMDCSGLGALIAAAHRLHPAGGVVALRHPRPIVRRLLRVCNVGDEPGLSIDEGA